MWPHTKLNDLILGKAHFAGSPAEKVKIDLGQAWLRALERLAPELDRSVVACLVAESLLPVDAASTLFDEETQMSALGRILEKCQACADGQNPVEAMRDRERKSEENDVVQEWLCRKARADIC